MEPNLRGTSPDEEGKGPRVVCLVPPFSRRTFLKRVMTGCLLGAGAVAVADVVQFLTVPGRERLPLGRGVVLADKELCSGCRVCETVCVTFNSQGRSAPSIARISLEKDYLGGDYEPNPCFQCVKPLCLEACPVAAIQVDEQSGSYSRIIDERVCIGCQRCVEGCGRRFVPPRPRYDSERGVSVKCHLCFGEPQCVAFCPYRALRVEWSDAGVETGYPIVSER